MLILFIVLAVLLIGLIGLVTYQRRRTSGNKGTHEAPWPGMGGHPDNFG